jgi:hypothetical protein
MAGGITEAVVKHAEAWLVSHGHSLEGIAHPRGAEARQMAALALELNVFVTSEPETSRLVVEAIAFMRSGGRVGNLG